MARRITGPVTVDQLGTALGVIKDDLSEIKSDTKETRETLAGLTVDLRGTKSRVKKLETRFEGATYHTVKDCPNTSAVADLRGSTGIISLDVNTAKSEIAGHSVDFADAKKRDAKRIYYTLSMVGMIVFGSFGWYSSRATMQANVSHLTIEQAKMGKRIDALTKAQNSQTVQVHKATEAVTKAAEKVSNGDHKQVSVDLWYRTLSESDKRLLLRRGITIPLSDDDNDLPGS